MTGASAPEPKRLTWCLAGVRLLRDGIGSLVIVFAAAPAMAGAAAAAEPVAAVVRTSNDARVARREPLIRFEIDRDVFGRDEIPRIFLQWLGAPEASTTRAPMTITVRGPGGKTIPKACPADDPLGDGLSRGPSTTGFDAFVVRSECFAFSAPGVYRVTARPRPGMKLGPADAPRSQLSATLSVRLIDQPPKIPSHAAADRRAFPLSVLHGPFAHCPDHADELRVTETGGKITTAPVGHPGGLPFPRELQPVVPTLTASMGMVRKPGAAPATAAALARTATGWLVGTNAGEFGGGLFAVDGPALAVTRVETGPAQAAQNVNGIVERGDAFVVFQGLFDSGRVTTLSRRGRNWTASLLADLHRSPAAWQRRRTSWLIVTDTGVIDVAADGRQTALGTFNTMAFYPNSLVEAADGTIWIGVRGGVVRLTPVWVQAPRYWAEYLVAPDAALVKAIAAAAPCQ
jgi:hypothetical protein